MDSGRRTVVETGLATSTVRTRTAARAFVCKVVSGSGEGRQVAMGARPVVVGADPACDLVLDDPKVSRRHAELHALEGGLRVRDLGATNGTYVDAVRVTEAVVALAASIRCGDTTLRVSAEPPPQVTPSARERFGALVGESLAMREVFAVLELASPTEATVLLQGESGTGKELAARAIHDHSARAAGPFVVVDCSAAAETLIESHLFGHKRGAFTGAVADRRGAFLEATGGTLFLDEIAELPLGAQARLLRVLEARTVQPLGSDRPVPTDVRVVAATHRDLYAMVEEKAFRFDLFHRLAVVHVQLPPLRERREDLPCLLRHFFEGRGVEPGPIAGDNLGRLQAHPFPGNVRELRNILDRAWVLSGGGAAFAALNLWLGSGVPSPFEVVDSTLPFKEAKERWVAAFERRYLADLYARYQGNITRAAEHAGLTRGHLRELLEQHGLKRS
ncbi:MAG: sigma 54-dependent Fis family transcriptional regulator [Myxococcales bacterium]|nr:sigma 54-dependent Fis family transcriptional regulator [Myxococcales bacterium]